MCLGQNGSGQGLGRTPQGLGLNGSGPSLWKVFGLQSKMQILES